MSSETPESIVALRQYFDGHQQAKEAITAHGVAAGLALSNQAERALNILGSPEKKWRVEIVMKEGDV